MVSLGFCLQDIKGMAPEGASKDEKEKCKNELFHRQGCKTVPKMAALKMTKFVSVSGRVRQGRLQHL